MDRIDFIPTSPSHSSPEERDAPDLRSSLIAYVSASTIRFESLVPISQDCRQREFARWAIQQIRKEQLEVVDAFISVLAESADSLPPLALRIHTCIQAASIARLQLAITEQKAIVALSEGPSTVSYDRLTQALIYLQKQGEEEALKGCLAICQSLVDLKTPHFELETTPL